MTTTVTPVLVPRPAAQKRDTVTSMSSKPRGLNSIARVQVATYSSVTLPLAYRPQSAPTSQPSVNTPSSQ